MKFIKYILKISLLSVFIFIGSMNHGLAGDPCALDLNSQDCLDTAGTPAFVNIEQGGDTAASGGRTVDVIVTERMPGITCIPQRPLYGADETGQSPTGEWGDASAGITESSRYRCEIPVGMEGALLVLGKMIRWLTGFAMVCAVLFLVFNGMRLTTSGVDPEAKGKVKSQIYMTLAGIIVLLLSGPILRLIAPWVYR